VFTGRAFIQKLNVLDEGDLTMNGQLYVSGQTTIFRGGSLTVANNALLTELGRSFVDNDGLLVIAGTVQSTVRNRPGNAQISIISSTAEISGSFENGGKVIIPSAQYRLLVVEDYEQNAFGTLIVTVDVNNMGKPFASRVDVEGKADLGGSLVVSQNIGVGFAQGTEFRVMSYKSHMGEFAEKSWVVGLTEFHANYEAFDKTALFLYAPLLARLDVQPPAFTSVGAPFDMTVAALDQFDNTFTGYTGTVHFASSDSTAMLPSDYTFTSADNGTHTFTGVVMNMPGEQSITATDSANSINGSAPIDVVLPAGITEFPTEVSGDNPLALTYNPFDGNFWFVGFGGSGSVGRITPDGTVTEVQTPTSGSGPADIAVGADGDLWITEFNTNNIARVDHNTLNITEYTIPDVPSGQIVRPDGIVLGSDGKIWFAEFSGDAIDSFDPTTGRFGMPIDLASGSNPVAVTTNTDGKLWFTEFGTSKIGYITPGGNESPTEIPVSSGSGPFDIDPGKNGVLTITELQGNQIATINADGSGLQEFSAGSGSNPWESSTGQQDGNIFFAENGGSYIGRMTYGGALINQFPTPTAGSGPTGMVDAPDGSIWFTEFNSDKIGRLVLLSATPVDLNATEGQSFSGTVGNFAFADPNVPAGNFTAEINWGDGSSPDDNTGIVATGGGNFQITGSHVYAEEGSYTLTITVNENYGATASATGTATVADAPLTAQAQPSNFQEVSGSPFAVGSTPDSVATGDFNNDGNLDLVVANFGSGTISVMLGNGDGTFQPAVNYQVGSGPNGFVIGDFNGDGTLDIAVGNFYSNTVSVLLGNGDGTFQQAVNYAVGSGPANVMAGADLTGSGIVDLVTANLNDGTVSVLMGNGDGTFQAAVNYQAGPGAIGVVAGDFNNDGKIDLATANYYGNSVSILLGNGDGTFAAPTTYSVGGSPFFITVADFRGTGQTDLAVANLAGGVSVLLSNGDGTLQPAVTYAAGANPTAVVAGDVNGDGKIDLVVSNYGSNNVSVLLGNGDGTFQSPQNFSAGSGPNGVILGDFNGDGKFDIAVANQNGNSVSVLLAHGLEAAAGKPFSGVLASFTDANPQATAADFTATIDWGDGTTSVVNSSDIIPNGQGGFDVMATHTYAQSGLYDINVLVEDLGGSATFVIRTVLVAP
jgi:streptogramin lyase